MATQTAETAEKTESAQQKGGAGRLLFTWTLVTLAILCLLAAGGWFGVRWHARRVLAELASERVYMGASFHPASVLLAEGQLSKLPDFIVYPVLLEEARQYPEMNHSFTASGSSGVESYYALLLLEAKARGGRQALLPGADTPEPLPGVEVWVGRLPRQLLEDLYLADNGPEVTHPIPGSGLINVLEPHDPRWQTPSSKDECRAALERLGIVKAAAKKNASLRSLK